jgi:hypothetical protein
MAPQLHLQYDKMGKGLTAFALLLFLLSCAGSVINEETNQGALNLTSIQGTSSSDRDSYDQENNYCDYILFHLTEPKVLIDYNFFPAGSDVCQQVTYDPEINPEGVCKIAKTVVLPCGYDGASAAADDLLSASISAPLDEGSCGDQLVIDLSTAGFTIDGLVFPFSGSLDVFSADLGFKITQEGVVNTATGAALSFSTKDFALDEIYEAIH